MAAIGGYLISNQHWYFGIVSLVSSFIVNFILSRGKQGKIFYGTSATLGPASNFPEGTIYMQYKN